MKSAAMALVTLLALAVTIESASASDPACQLRRYSSLDVNLDHGYPLIPVTAQQRDAWIVFDTTAVVPLIYERYVHDYTSSTRKLASDSPGIHIGRFNVRELGIIDDLRLGTARFRKGEFAIYEEEATERSELPEVDGKPIIGRMSLTFFANSDVEIDLARHKINLYEATHCPDGAVVYWTNHYSEIPLKKGALGTYYFPMELDGRRVEATLTTTSQFSTLTTDVSRKLYDFDETSAGIEHRRTRGGTLSHYRSMSISTDSLHVSNTDILLMHSSVDCLLGKSAEGAAIHEACYGGEAPLQLGLPVIKKLHLYFATHDNKLYFTSAGDDQTNSPATGSSAPASAPAQRP
ncbi:MAG TPA: hypothetical protein VMC02_01415 [Steroidobacteraceae bacterium]|nr:hypothetical protein [Steroidobacteraceae bacterium]